MLSEFCNMALYEILPTSWLRVQQSVTPLQASPSIIPRTLQKQTIIQHLIRHRRGTERFGHLRRDLDVVGLLTRHLGKLGNDLLGGVVIGRSNRSQRGLGFRDLGLMLDGGFDEESWICRICQQEVLFISVRNKIWGLPMSDPASINGIFASLLMGYASMYEPSSCLAIIFIIPV